MQWRKLFHQLFQRLVALVPVTLGFYRQQLTKALEAEQSYWHNRIGELICEHIDQIRKIVRERIELLDQLVTINKQQQPATDRLSISTEVSADAIRAARTDTQREHLAAMIAEQVQQDIARYIRHEQGRTSESTPNEVPDHRH